MSIRSRINPIDPDAYKIYRMETSTGVELAYVREGLGGVPLLLLHGWPATKRIFYQNIASLAEAGFEVIAPDAAGWGDSPIPAKGYADFTSSAHDFKALMEQLGHERWVLGAFDFGSVSALHMVTRFPEKIIRLVLWSAAVPQLAQEYEALGLGGDLLNENEEISHHIRTHGTDADAFVKRFAGPEERRAYVTGFYQGRAWKEGGPIISLAAPGRFSDEEAAFHSQPFEDSRKFRASLNYYTAFLHPEYAYEPLQLTQKVHTETLYMYGIEDKLMGLNSIRRAEIAFPNLVGPFLVGQGGHFLSWERPKVVNSAIISFCRDLLAQDRSRNNGPATSFS